MKYDGIFDQAQIVDKKMIQNLFPKLNNGSKVPAVVRRTETEGSAIVNSAIANSATPNSVIPTSTVSASAADNRATRFGLRFGLRILIAVVSVGMVGASSQQADAQLFGNQRATPFDLRSSNSEAGTIKGNERFLRRNRTADAFVGKSDDAGFVGSVQANATSATPSTASLRKIQDKSSQINRTLSSTALPYYEPKLTVAFQYDRQSRPQKASEIQNRIIGLTDSLKNRSISLTLQGRTAILKGSVESDRQKRLIEMLVLFEPGVSKVENELQVPPSNSAVPQKSENRVVSPQSGSPN